MAVISPPGLTQTGAKSLLASTATGILVPSERERTPRYTDDASKGFRLASEGGIGRVWVSAGGSGYTSATVDFSAPPAGGTQATGVAILSLAGSVAAVLVTNPGAGYTTAPTITISGNGTGAAASTSLAGTSLWNSVQGSFWPVRTTSGLAAWRLRDPVGLPQGLMTGALFAGGTVRTVPGYAGAAIRVVRASDSTTLDIGFLANGNLDVDAMDAFGAGTSLTVSIVYDQTGNGNHLTQTTASARPTISGVNTLHGPGSTRTIYFDGTQFTPGAYQWLDIPNAVATTTSGVSAFMVGRVNSDISYAPLLGLTAGTNPLSFGYGTSARTFYVVGGGQAKTAPFKPTIDASVFGFTTGPAGTYMRMNNSEFQQGTIATATAMTGGTVGANAQMGGTTGVTGSFEFCSLAIYGSQISRANLVELYAAYYNRFDITPQYTDVIIGEGDSITAGLKTTRGQHPVRLWANLLQLPARYYNGGWGGVTALTLNQNVAANVIPKLNPSARNNVVVMSVGTNDFTANNALGADVFAYQMSECAQIKAACPNVKFVFGTTIPRGAFSADNRTQAAILQGLIRANGGAVKWDALADYGADPIMGADSYTTSIYTADATHPNDLGYALMATILAKALRSVWNF